MFGDGVAEETVAKRAGFIRTAMLFLKLLNGLCYFLLLGGHLCAFGFSKCEFYQGKLMYLALPAARLLGRGPISIGVSAA
jgi:hypothetical protein